VGELAPEALDVRRWNVPRGERAVNPDENRERGAHAR
jgi:hypothetical protein